jgi:alpha-ketoglutarate-dependent taurine dioxygenase
VKVESEYGTRYSRTSQALAPHTDGSMGVRPCDIVILYCVAAEDEGGDTILVPLDDIGAKLSEDQYNILRVPTFPFGRKVFPIIETVRGQDTIRYHRTQILKAVQHQGAGLLIGADDTLEALDQALENPSIQVRFKLQPQDLLLINNRKTLHGRTKMSDEGERLLLRARVFSKKLM